MKNKLAGWSYGHLFAVLAAIPWVLGSAVAAGSVGGFVLLLGIGVALVLSVRSWMGYRNSGES